MKKNTKTYNERIMSRAIITRNRILCENIIQLCSGITRGTVLNGELYAQRLQKLIYLHLFTDCFMKVSLQSSEHI